MMRLLTATALAAALWAAQPAAAQTRSGSDDVKKLEAELDKLRAQVKEVEARLKKAKDATAKGGGRGTAAPWGRGGFPFGPGGRMDPEKMKEMREQFEKMRKESEKKGDKKDDKRPSSPRGGFGPRGFGGGFRPGDTRGGSDLEKRLDRILKEVEELRRELKKR